MRVVVVKSKAQFGGERVEKARPLPCNALVLFCFQGLGGLLLDLCIHLLAPSLKVPYATTALGMISCLNFDMKWLSLDHS